jgi:hypothetical protein
VTQEHLTGGQYPGAQDHSEEGNKPHGIGCQLQRSLSLLHTQTHTFSDNCQKDGGKGLRAERRASALMREISPQ